ncbi:hypothetical protein P43SY_011137 [Pythium insidiosum]|uniref:Equilibrative Nucleoside Transporter (ENT) Family n=1 Tax=Pythium insidiosum TaxID=114742 RepID=A0AAD5LS75_PYTIN|nr:hypothetical protein P43SY_011137 [Pythium insidiosum]
MNSPLARSPSTSRTTGSRYDDDVAEKAAWLESGAVVDSTAVVPGLTPQQHDQEERMACVLFTLVGIGYLFPFSALTQPVDYWKMLFPDFNVEFAITSTFMYTNLAFLGLIVVAFGKPWYTGRIVGGFIGQLVVLVFVPTSYFFLSTERANTIAVVGGTAAVSIATAFIDSCTIALVSQFPLRVQESFQLGVGLSTLIGSFYRDLTKLVFPANELVVSTLIYFYVGAITIAVCIYAYFRLMRLRITQHYVVDAKSKASCSVELTEKSGLLAHQNPGVISEPSRPPSKWSVLRKVLHLELLISLVFVTSLSLWPPLVTEIKSFNFPSLDQSGWWSLLLLTVFSVADCVGRFTVSHRWILTPQNIWIAVVARFVLVPILVSIVKGYVFTHDLCRSLAPSQASS